MCLYYIVFVDLYTLHSRYIRGAHIITLRSITGVCVAIEYAEQALE